ncbi:uncharacterized protein N7459_004126 [Penicillium hispanicum]|uniref:uncharacterized protein n=1 Tax=Penicillium hispanicum TaxID=1080232 RepID=UPI00253FCECE|nr:uncharacterized protein N7459_004126 [Penicillium hispanicum]KAJ5584326.1 hypothetical protein N7459_004126 [Penicillium hispanicum]
MGKAVPPTSDEINLSGKTVVVTGGNSGLGWEFARQSLILNASRVIITTRSESKGNAALASLRADPEVKSRNPHAQLEFFDLDLDDYESGLHFTRRIKEQVPDLDILLCNGGTNLMHYETSKSGHERVMQVNCYTHFLVVLSLLPLLKATAARRGSPSRVTFMSSYSHTRHTLEKIPIAMKESVLEHYDDRSKFRGLARYQDSKLVLNAFVYQLSTMVSPSEIIVNSVCPGIVATNLNHNLPCWIKPLIYVLYRIKGRTLCEGGRLSIHAAVVAGKDSHGKFLQDGHVNSGAPFLSQPAGKQYMEKLWWEIVGDAINVNPEIETLA